MRSTLVGGSCAVGGWARVLLTPPANELRWHRERPPVALFDPNVTLRPAPPRRRSRGAIVGLWSLAVALVALLVLTFLPTSYVIQQPGPVYNTLGSATDADGVEVPLINVDGAETFETSGNLDLLTVQVLGSRERTPSWFELGLAWFDTSRAVVPIDAIFPVGQTSEQRNEENATLMVNSQQDATAAALHHLGYDTNPRLAVVALTEDSPSEGILQADDVIVQASGSDVTELGDLRERIAAGAGAPVELQIEREGEFQEVAVTPQEIVTDAGTTWAIGVGITTNYEFPFDVTILLDNVGGPSAGMMFALGIIDVLTPEDLTGGAHVAGTGTIDAAGVVGPIGGIRQKLWGAHNAGAKYFLAPAANCGEVVGHVPSGLEVFKVEKLDDAIEVLKTVKSGGDFGALPRCD